MAGVRIGVVGGGAIGLAAAWEMARAGCQVTLFDAAPEAREASWAAAGMLAPHHEADTDNELWRLGVASLARWPGFARQLADAAALDFREDGGLVPLVDPADEAAIAGKRAFLAGAGVDSEWLDRSALRQREPALAGDLAGALLIPAAQVNPRLLIQALRRACAALGVMQRYAEIVDELTIAAAGCVLRLASGEAFACDQVVLASGAWTPALGRLAGIDLAGEPVKGQMLRLAADDRLLGHFIHSHHAYLVPRHGLGVVVGATMVQTGFDKSDDAAAIHDLAAGARRLLPALADAAILETWTGLRPRLKGGLPVIARARPGLTIATGHFRNGILLCPITAAAITALVLGTTPPCDLRAFNCPP